MFFSENNRLSKPHFDWPLLVTSYLLALYGVLAITIANFNPSLGSDRSLQDLIMDANNGRLQLMWVVVSMVVVAIIMSINYNIIGRLWPVIYFVDVLLLGLVLTTSKINGVRGWFQFLDRTFQPSELAKLALIITLSKALTRYPDRPIPNFRYFVYICMHFGIPALLIAAQPDIGTLMVFCIIFIALLFVSGFELKWMFLLGGIVAAGITPIIFYLASTNNFRWLRLVAFINPESDPTGSSYQIVNSKITIGSGGLYGKGAWAEGTLTHLNYVPENHTDFIFSVVGETLGFFGSLVLLALYAFVIYRMLVLAFHTNDKFGQLIIIGVMAVIVIVGLGNGMTKSMRDSFSALGTNTLSIQVWGYGSRTVPVDDMYDICQRHSDLIKAVSPQIEFSGNASGTLKIGTTSYRWSNISGVDENYTEMKNYQIAQGRGLQYMDMQDNKQVCIIGDYLNRVAFGGNAVGQTLKIGANKFRIVGVLAAKVSNPTMQQGSDDDCVYLPYTTVMRLSSQSAVNNYTAVMTDENFANEAKTTMEEELQKILKTENGYYVYSASEWLEEMNKMINMVIVVLTGIASISLLVGGIGIMNIMYVSVTERTREIGLRMSIGAKGRDILAQFLIESILISVTGGLIGVVFGIGAAVVVNLAAAFPIYIQPWSVLLSFAVCTLTGVFFGWYPAQKAAMLDPIEAIRYE